MRYLLLLWVGIVFADAVWAVDVPMSWSPVVGAAGYAIERSIDSGATWEGSQDTSNTATPDDDGGQSVKYTYADCPEDAFVVFRVMSVSSGGNEFVRTWSGAWYDHRLKPLNTPGGAGIN